MMQNLFENTQIWLLFIITMVWKIGEKQIGIFFLQKPEV